MFDSMLTWILVDWGVLTGYRWLGLTVGYVLGYHSSGSYHPWSGIARYLNVDCTRPPSCPNGLGVDRP